MAEYAEVMKQFVRMCDSFKGDCTDCPLNDTNPLCALMRLNKSEIQKIENTVMQWATEHPEPLYPTWEQWHKKMFPAHGSILKFTPCVFISKKVGNCAGKSLEELGIKNPCNGCRKRLSVILPKNWVSSRERSGSDAID